jgi:glycosyltransferase involved in cell wall biosynthesis
MTVPLRILHLISRLDGYGEARLLRSLAPRHAAMGRRVNVVALSADNWVVQELHAAGVPVSVFGSRWTFDPIAISRLARWRRHDPADLVHAWDPVAWMHGSITGPRDRLIAAWTSRSRRRPAFAQWFADAPTSIPPGVPEVAPFARERAAVFAELGLAQDARMIAVATPLVRAKELDEAIWSFELVRVLHPTARLVVFGDGPDRPRLERYAELVSEPGCVQFAGFRAALAELLPHVDVFWQLDPSQSTPYALLEAMAAGVPVVASDVPAHRSAITPGKTKLLVGLRRRADVARVTDQLLTDASLTRDTSGAAAVLQKWSIANSAAACEALYQALRPRSRVC